MSPVICCHGSFHACRSSANDYHMLFLFCFRQIQSRWNKFLIMISWIYGAAYIPVVCGNVITVGASETRNNVFRMPLQCFLRPVWISQKCSSKCHHIHITLCNNFICHFRRHNGADHRNRNLKLLFCNFCPFEIRHFFFQIGCDAMHICFKHFINSR